MEKGAITWGFGCRGSGSRRHCWPYAQYIETGITFEYELPSREEFARRIREFGGTYPYLIWEEDGRIVGYAYAHRQAERAAYQWNAELSVYLGPGPHRHRAWAAGFTLR